MLKRVVFRPSLVCAVLVGVACSADGGDTASPAGRADEQRSISFQDAVATAQAEVPDGIPYEVEIERLDGRDVIEVELFVGAIIREVHIDPITGDVISVVDETDGEQTVEQLEEQAQLMGGAALTLPDAAKRAEAHTGGEALEVEYKVVDGTLVAEVEVRLADGQTTVHLDPTDGHVLSGTADDEPDDDPAEDEDAAPD